jgi:hypothetical protein
VRAPFGVLAGLLDLEEPGLFRLTALPCLFAFTLLAVHLAGRARSAFPRDRWWLLVLGLVAASPLAWKAVWFGHPEELMATALAVGAVLAALREKAVLAGLMLGAAVASKQWAVIAVLPTLLAVSHHHLRLLAVAAGAGGALLLPIILADPGGYAATQQSIASSAHWFRPRQLWWPLGEAPAAELGAPGGAAVTPQWLALVAKPLIVAITIPLSALWLRRRTRRADALLLLALLLLGRCLLDPWNVVYYHLPLIVALLAWEVVSGRRIPVLTLVTTGAVWLSFETLDTPYGLAPWLTYLAWTLPLGAHLAWRLYQPAVPAVRTRVAIPA